MPVATPKRYVAVGAFMALVAGFLFWVGYSWPERRFELKARGVSVGTAEYGEQEGWRLDLSLREQIAKVDKFHPDEMWINTKGDSHGDD